MSRIDEVAEQVSKEVRTRKAISILMVNKDEQTRDFILRTYTDPELHSMYNALRTEASLNSRMGDSKRLSIKFPNPTVWKFCDDVMKAKYGEEWLQDPKIFYEDLIIPWVIRRK